MGLRKDKSSLDIWLDRGRNPEKLWKLVFYFFSRFILAFCVLHYFGVAYPQIGRMFPGPTSEMFWAYCVLFTAIFASVFYVIRGKRRGSGSRPQKDNVESSPAIVAEPVKLVEPPIVVRPAMVVEPAKVVGPAKVVEEKRESHPGGVGRAIFAPVVLEEKREGRLGGVGRATFAAEPEVSGPETSGPKLEEERSEDQRDRRE